MTPDINYGYFMEAYALAHPDAPVATFWWDFSTELSYSLKDIPCYEMVLPEEYKEEVFDQTTNLLLSL